jgi:hypothetical protein
VAGWIPAADLEPVLAAATEAYRASGNGRGNAGDLLPGIRALLERLESDERFKLGVVTGGGSVASSRSSFSGESYPGSSRSAPTGMRPISDPSSFH